ncbi:5-oxoprolinase subunit PxpA [uncultured Thioclava sp.]|uniref:LamB/YcsF family protein n=1 Tax=uncultured Thioclava sp. TaxID=473858 RepID=UPI0025F0743A|nr:5-oxoprolinase subunit PxpA [uncultured Thioclava sp.]
MLKVDLNSDIGEGFGPWATGDDAGLMEVISSANIACGFHAGDPDVMATTMDLAQRKGVALGAHPGFPDLQGFGRRRMGLSPGAIRNLITYQLGAAQAMARAAGGSLRHFKLHGALSNMASEDAALARTCFEAALRVQSDLVIMVQPLTAMDQAVRDLGCAWAGEIYADRSYNDDATLCARSAPGAVLHDPTEIATRMLEMLRAGAIIARSGKQIRCRIDTICVHGDTAGALGVARKLRQSLEAADVAIAPF